MFCCERGRMVWQRTLQDYINKYKPILQSEMKKNLEHLDIPSSLKESMLYSLEAGGKRLRPILMLASYQLFQQYIRPVMNSAVALEMVHTYSLIHDDVPANDNEEYSRGKTTNHKAFD